jgi:hypothetical protein
MRPALAAALGRLALFSRVTETHPAIVSASSELSVTAIRASRRERSVRLARPRTLAARAAGRS